MNQISDASHVDALKASGQSVSDGSFLWLTESDVVSLVDINDCIDGLEAGVAALGRNEAKNIPKALGTWGDGSSVHSLGSVNISAGFTGFKTWANTKRGATALFVLFGADDGQIKAVFEAAALGSLRTSAISGLATRWLSRPDADELSIIGTGRQALTQVAAVAAVRDLQRVRVFSPRADSRNAFAETLNKSFNFDVVVSDTVQEAVKDAPIVTTVTRSKDPFLTSDMLAPGAHLNAVGAVLPPNAEFTDDVFVRASVIAVDSLDNVRAASREFLEYFQDGAGDWSRVITLGDVISAGKMRAIDADVTLFKAMGMGISDLSVAIIALARAKERGIGQSMAPPERVQPKWKG